MFNHKPAHRCHESFAPLQESQQVKSFASADSTEHAPVEF
jgi:hypothetical protein